MAELQEKLEGQARDLEDHRGDKEFVKWRAATQIQAHVRGANARAEELSKARKEIKAHKETIEDLEARKQKLVAEHREKEAPLREHLVRVSTDMTVGRMRFRQVRSGAGRSWAL